MRRLNVFALVAAVELAALLAVARHAAIGPGGQVAGGTRGGAEIVRLLGITDLALWTEARYTRHPSQADLFSAFQEFPSSLEHFPAGSLCAPSGGARPRAAPR